MKVARKLTPLIMAFALISCNEQVSPKLQDANSSSVVPPTITPTEYYFKLKDTSALIQNYKLHRTGAANAAATCEVRKNIPLTNDLFLSPGAADSDITCFFEAEELSLFHGGFSFEFEASPNTCDYVSYTPFSYYNRIPGDSSSELTQVICETETVTPTHIDTVGGSMVELNSGGVLGCDQYADDNLDPTQRTFFSVETDDELCRFNYKDGDQEQCDQGVINVTELKVSHTPADADAGTPEIIKSTINSRIVRCGGKHYNCVGGPIRAEESASAEKTSKYSIIYQTVKNEKFVQSRTYEAVGGSPINMTYANHRRFLSSPIINFVNPSSGSYNSAFTGAKDYTGNVMENYSKNIRMDELTPVVSATELANASIVYRGGRPAYTAKPLAAEPYLGLLGRTSPFYTFECLDRAYETKARIRMVVRDWDRIYSGDAAKQELISDINEGYNARQDNIDFLNLLDWDDFIPMSRSSGAFDPTNTKWEPHNGSSTLLFSPAIFPNISNE
jgi:hypothetical protein